MMGCSHRESGKEGSSCMAPSLSHRSHSTIVLRWRERSKIKGGGGRNRSREEERESRVRVRVRAEEGRFDQEKGGRCAERKDPLGLEMGGCGLWREERALTVACSCSAFIFPCCKLHFLLAGPVWFGFFSLNFLVCLFGLEHLLLSNYGFYSRYDCTLDFREMP